MKTKHIFWGVFLITIGLLVLLRNYFDFDFQWGDIWKLWPLVLVLFGIHVMIKNQLFKTILSVLTGLLLAFALYASAASLFGLINEDFEVNVNDDYDYDISTYSTEFDESIKRADLEVEAGGGSFFLADTTELLFNADVEGNKNRYSLTANTGSGEADLLFQMHTKKIVFGRHKNRVEMKLNPKPVWNMNFDIGAAAVDFDMSPYKIETLDIQMGAASLKLRLGSLNSETHVNIDAGASSIDIDIPEDAGCEIRANVSLSSKTFEGFTKNRDNIYRTGNFGTAKNKIFIDLESGVSSIEVNRYSW